MHMSSCPLSGSGVLSSVGTTLHIPRPIETTAEPTRETTRAPAATLTTTAIRAECGADVNSSSVTPHT